MPNQPPLALLQAKNLDSRPIMRYVLSVYNQQHLFARQEGDSTLIHISSGKSR
jgi:hypothetical protein